MSTKTDRERLVSFSTWLLEIASGDIETVPGGTHDDVEIPSSKCLNNNFAIINIVCDSNLQVRVLKFAEL